MPWTRRPARRALVLSDRWDRSVTPRLRRRPARLPPHAYTKPWPPCAGQRSSIRCHPGARAGLPSLLQLTLAAVAASATIVPERAVRHAPAISVRDIRATERARARCELADQRPFPCRQMIVVGDDGPSRRLRASKTDDHVRTWDRSRDWPQAWMLAMVSRGNRSGCRLTMQTLGVTAGIATKRLTYPWPTVWVIPSRIPTSPSELEVPCLMWHIVQGTRYGRSM